MKLYKGLMSRKDYREAVNEVANTLYSIWMHKPRQVTALTFWQFVMSRTYETAELHGPTMLSCHEFERIGLVGLMPQRTYPLLDDGK